MKEKNCHITTSSDSFLGQAWVWNKTMPLKLATSPCCEQSSFSVPFSKIRPECQHLPQIIICQSQFTGRWKSLVFSVTQSGLDSSLGHSSYLSGCWVSPTTTLSGYPFPPSKTPISPVQIGDLEASEWAAGGNHQMLWHPESMAGKPTQSLCHVPLFQLFWPWHCHHSSQ